MKNKTTLQKLVEAIKKRDIEVYHTTKEGIVISRLEEFLKMEQQELIEAHSEGIRFMAEDSTVPQPDSIIWFCKKYMEITDLDENNEITIREDKPF